MGNYDSLTPEEQQNLYVVGCVICGKQVFRFSQNYLTDCGEISLVCPECGQRTKVDGNGTIQAG